MKIKSVTLKNFRGYKDSVTIQFQDLTVFVGQNDIGKSAVLEALDIFFNDGSGAITMDKGDVNKKALSEGDNEIIIGVEFNDLPNSIVLDESPATTLNDEYLLNSHGNLNVVKKYKNGGKAKIFIKAIHPSNPDCSNLLLLKIADLKSIVKKNGIVCEDLAQKVQLRRSIWKHYANDLNLEEREIETSGDGLKDIWAKLEGYLPLYSLFQSDRNNSDKDKEAQDPLKEAVKTILSDNELKSELNDIAVKVTTKLQSVTTHTLKKLSEMNPEIASTLSPQIPPVESLKWSDVFKGVSITSDEEIPINKRGSGVKRLVLLNFFRAEAERVRQEKKQPNIVYAIEEPETSQHVKYQKILIDSLISLSKNILVQIVLTTHSSFIVKQMKYDNLRLIYSECGVKRIRQVDPQLFPIPSLNEINYIAFGEISEEYHNELYGYLQSKAIDENDVNEKEKDFDIWLVRHGCIQNYQWKISRGTTAKVITVTLHTYIRNSIHHPENKLNSHYSIADLHNSIEKLRQIASSF